MDKYEKAAIDHDRVEINRLKAFLMKVDAANELRFVGQSVTDWALDLIARKGRYQPNA